MTSLDRTGAGWLLQDLATVGRTAQCACSSMTVEAAPHLVAVVRAGARFEKGSS
jgi:hypothetical protein